MLKKFLKLSEKEVQYYIESFDKAFTTASQEIQLDEAPLVIATSSRTGGMYLAALLQNHGYFEVDEYLNPFIHSGVALDGNQYLRDLEMKGVHQNKKFGMKVSIYDLLPYIFQYTPPFKFSDAKWIYLTREDPLDQAISLVLAEKTRVWSIRCEKDKLDELPITADDISAELVLDRLAVIVEDMRRWEIFFSFMGIAPFRLTYVELNSDPAGVMRKLSERFGLSCDTLNLEVSIQKQRDSRNDEVRRKVEAYIAQNTVASGK